MSKIVIGTTVERIGSGRDNGKTGEVIEIKADRARVRWTKGPRTWVNFRFLMPLHGPASATVVNQPS